MDYLEVCLSVAAEDGDRAAGNLLAAGFAGLVLDEERFDPLEPATPDDPGLPWRGAPRLQTLRVYVATAELPGRLDTVRAALQGIHHEMRTRLVAEEDWAESWKRFWEVQHIGRQLVVKPSWKEHPAQPGELVIELDPRQAFGTGTHPTTRLCLEALERLVRRGDVMYDVGTGSGILAIAAVLLGCRTAQGVDTDGVAVAAARENADINHVADRCSFECGSAGLLVGRADVVVANILAEAIVDMAPALALLCSRDLVVSGIIARKADQTRAALEAHDLVHVRTDSDGDWVAQHFSRISS